MGKMNTQDKKSQEMITPEMALQILKDGNSRFLNDTGLERDYHYQVKETSKGQFPFAVILSCIDSRIPTEIIFDNGIGDIFNARIAGNIVNEDILGSMEFACKLSGAKLILVLGHTACGAVQGACDDAKLGNLTGLLDKIKPSVNQVETEPNTDRTSQNAKFVDDVAIKNVEITIAEIKNKSDVLNEMFKNKVIEIVGAMYNVNTGVVEFMS